MAEIVGVAGRDADQIRQVVDQKIVLAHADPVLRNTPVQEGRRARWISMSAEGLAHRTRPSPLSRSTGLSPKLARKRSVPSAKRHVTSRQSGWGKARSAP